MFRICLCFLILVVSDKMGDYYQIEPLLMTCLSVNLNKIALLRNARGRDYPNVVDFARKMIGLGADGITVHPRQDERHATRQDVRDLAKLIAEYPRVEFNVEGYPSKQFMQLIEETRPDQCTLVPDSPDQITSDHGWDAKREQAILKKLGKQLSSWGVRSSVFLDADPEQVIAVSSCHVDRIELYTEQYAVDYLTSKKDSTLKLYSETAKLAQENGLGVNAGHDLDLANLAFFLKIPGILEVSIGHALTVECLLYGMKETLGQYVNICQSGRS